MMLSAFSCASGAHQQMIMWLAQWRQLTNGTHTVSLSALIDYDSYMDRYSMQSRCSVCVLFLVFAITFHRYLRSTICSLFNLGATYARMKTNKMTIYVGKIGICPLKPFKAIKVAIRPFYESSGRIAQ